MEIDELKRDKHQAEQDLSVAERKNDVLQRKIGEFDDRSLNNTNLMNGRVYENNHFLIISSFCQLLLPKKMYSMENIATAYYTGKLFFFV